MTNLNQGFLALWEETKVKWLLLLGISNALTGENEFIKHFDDTWVKSDFCFWGVGNTPPGFKTTNNPVEQLNGLIKKYYTFRKLQGSCRLMKTFDSLVSDESGINKKDFVEILVVIILLFLDPNFSFIQRIMFIKIQLF